MLDARQVTDTLEDVRARLATRGPAAAASLDRIAALAAERSGAITRVEALRAERNEASAAMATLDKKSPEFTERRNALKSLGDRIKELEATRDRVQGELDELILHVPNLPHESVPLGASEHDNPVVRTWGEPPKTSFAPKDHVEIATALGIVDFTRAAKLSGARFNVLRGMGARLERALISFMLDLHTSEHGYEELWPPALVRDSAMRGTGQLPKFEKDAFKILRHYEAEDQTERVELYLSPTAEVQITNFHADEIFEAAELPKAYTAYTPCFRAEAGTYGKDTRGMIRQHQFDKVELVHFCAPEDAPATLERLVGHAEEVLRRLGLAHRTIELCTADLGFASQKTYDIEVWLPGQSAYREISSCSWFGDFQARRAAIRYRPEAGAKPRLVHTLNGSGLAVGRTLVAILEQYQQEDGSVVVPEALRGYVGRERITAS
ncbi:MAG: serine--tRNA ligase [Sandaracinaceae bacterium]|nr:serine--tRNA ligase [Sandaracinaceae bacterium]